MKTRVLLFGTHPSQYNGYSKIVYELVSQLAKKADLDMHIYGFQKFSEDKMHKRSLPDNVTIYDAFANEEPKKQGFGFDQVQDYVKKIKPDICIVYNDMAVIHNIVTSLTACKQSGMNFKIITYIDQVYLNQKNEFIDFINKNSDFALLFTKHWEDSIVEQGVTIDHDFLPHGLNTQNYYPIPKHICRHYFGFNPKDFLILNLNRNQPRKRWDICLKAFAEIVSRYPNENIKMIVGTGFQGAWNLKDIFERELKKRSISLAQGMQHLIVLDEPQKLTDEDINILYNAADIGINTCDGEGFGLCNFEQAAVGIPQIIPKLGGFLDFFDDNNSMLIEPIMAYYVDNSRDSVAGEALLCNYIDYVEAIEKYYFEKDLRLRHGEANRKNILKNYSWVDISNKLYAIINKVVGGASVSLLEEVEKIDNTLLEDSNASVSTPTQSSISRLQKTKEKQIKKLQRKLDKLKT